jgi:geranylgeranyl pyrophosphate synthase
MKNRALEIELFLKKELINVLPEHEINKVFEYALFPSGKLIRSQLILNIFDDLKETKSKSEINNLHLACAFIEFHHAYSLVHDDLPCMDNDDERRGKPTTHKAYGEWRALLTGDGLITASFSSLAKIQSPHLRALFRFATWATGPKGLILGQVMDLSQEMNQNLPLLIKTHELKTARLFQMSALLAYYIALNNQNPSMNKIRSFLNLGKNIGITFQLLDDLSDLIGNISEHENEINPFLVRKQEATHTLTQYYQCLIESLQNYPKTKIFLEETMFFPMKKKLLNEKKVFTDLGIDLEVIFAS